jgi:FlaA1/EpsC-like NDP-sugar epimerase/UDP-N-acetylmuramyl pentapeptide phosphotransferase/UDP-N-acetylglucosamine-1-phosphate transferase
MKTLILAATILTGGWLSWYLTRCYLLFAQDREILDTPNHRSSHSTPTPRGGGIAFVIVFLLVSTALGAVDLISPRETFGLLAGALVAAAGYWDDCAGVSIRVRLMMQIAAASFAIFCFSGTEAVLPPSATRLIAWVVSVLMVLAFVWLTNLTNFMDGIDGLAGTEALIVGAVCCLLSSYRHGFDGLSMLLAVLSVSALGFLGFNWPPAKIFMGDVGSSFLGYCFAALALLTAVHHRLSLWTPIILLGVFVIDASVTLMKRMARGDEWYLPHHTHAFQHLSRRYGHRRTTLTVAAVNIVWLTPWAILADRYPAFGFACLIAAWFPLVVAVHLLRAGQPLPGNTTMVPISFPLIRLGRLTRGLYYRGKSKVGAVLLSLARLLEAHPALCQLTLLCLVNYGCVYFAFFTRFDGSIPAEWLSPLRTLALIWTVVEGMVLFIFRTHRSHWRFTSADELPSIAGISLVAAVIGAFIVAIVATACALPLPRSVYLLNTIYCVASFLSVRLLSRFVYDRMRTRANPLEEKRVLIYGADRSGVGILSELRRHCLEYRAVGFIDDRSEAQGIWLSGLPVLGSRAEIGKLARKYRVHQVLVPSSATVLEAGASIVHCCVDAQVDYRVLTTIDEDIRLNRRRPMRDVAVEELLGRHEVTLDTSLIHAKLTGKVVMVTGAAGSIGSEICRQLANLAPSALIAYEMSETALFYVEREIRERFPSLPFVACIGSVQNYQRLADVLRTYQPEVVYHAAAYKHVGLMEQHIFEVIENNVFGTAALVRACEAHGVRTLVMISTDKAVRPTSVMGVSKRIAEMIVRASSSPRMTCVSTRFGNVLGSNGSVLPLFTEQIAKGGPVKVTHPDMVRFFMTIPEAAQLVIQASSLGSSNEIFVLDMGSPVRIVDLAERLIRLMGLVPGKDVAIEFTGIRPGEKLVEEVAMTGEEVTPTKHAKIFVFRDVRSFPHDLANELRHLRAACNQRDLAAVLSLLQEIVPDYTPSAAIKTADDAAQREIEMVPRNVLAGQIA